MKRSPVTCLGVALVLILATAGSARAELIHWMYNWSRSPAVINADSPGTGYITLTDETTKTAVGDSNIVATNLKTYSTATVDNPDKFTAKPYTLSLQLTDVGSLQSTTLTFQGKLDGTLTAMSANIKNTFVGPTSYDVVLGENKYTITLPTYTPPGPPGTVNLGSISVRVESLVTDLPEPGTLVLSGLGALLFGLRRLRRRLKRLPPGAET
jgi:hypothetical protein